MYITHYNDGLMIIFTHCCAILYSFNIDHASFKGGPIMLLFTRCKISLWYPQSVYVKF